MIYLQRLKCLFAISLKDEEIKLYIEEEGHKEEKKKKRKKVQRRKINGEERK